MMHKIKSKKNWIFLISSVFILSILIFSIFAVAAPSNKGKKNKKGDIIKIDIIDYVDGKTEVMSEEAQISADLDEPVCYKFLDPNPNVKLRRHTLPIIYEINPVNTEGLTESFVINATSKAAKEWNSKTGMNLFSDSYIINRKCGKHYLAISHSSIIIL